MLFFRPVDNTIQVTRFLLKALDVRITHTKLKDELKNHSEYPSLLAVSEVLNSFEIDNYVIEATVKDLSEVPTPCLAALTTEGVYLLS